MEILLITALIILFLTMIIVQIILFNKQTEKQQNFATEQQKLLANTQGNINERLSASNQTINDMKKELGVLEETARNIQSVGKNLSDLQNLLKAPAFKGGFGEYLLNDLLSQIFPSANFKTQYRFSNNKQVDAVIKLKDKVIPIDSKFPIASFQKFINADNENDKKLYRKDFNSDLKKNIDDIEEKYIKHVEGTFGFALMYIPAENIYYETIIKDPFNENFELLRYALEKHVIPVSPNSFYAYLMAITFGLNGLRVEQDIQIILEDLRKIHNRFKDFYKDYGLVRTHLSQAVSKFDETAKTAEKLNDQINKITGQKTELIEEN